MSALGQKQTLAALSRHAAFLNMTQTTMPITIIAAAKTIRKVLVSSAMERPFFPGPAQCACSSGHVSANTSALPQKADMCGALAHVCYGPIADDTIARPLFLLRL